MTQMIRGIHRSDSASNAYFVYLPEKLLKQVGFKDKEKLRLKANSYGNVLIEKSDNNNGTSLNKGKVRFPVKLTEKLRINENKMVSFSLTSQGIVLQFMRK